MPRILAGGDTREQGVRIFYGRYAAAMMRFFIYRGLNADEAQDVFQETLIRIIRHTHQYQNTGQENAWFWQIARNCLTDFLRKKLRTQSVETIVDALEDLPVAAADCDTTDRSVEGCVDAGLDRFRQKEPDRVYALSLQMNGLSINEISTRIGRTLGATKEYLSQCRKKAHPYIAHCYELLGA